MSWRPSLYQVELALFLAAAFQRVAHPSDQFVGKTGLGDESVAAHRSRLLPRVVEGVRGERENWNVLRGGVGLQLFRRLPAVEHRHARVHENDVGLQRDGAVRSEEHT